MTFDLVPRERRELAPGAVHVPDWLDVPTQRSLVGHGVPKLLPHSPADIPEIALGRGRLTITLRVSGLQPDDRRRGSAVQNERRRGIP